MSTNNKKKFPYWRTKCESYFDIGDHTVRVDMSTISGRESVFLDDKLVSKKRNLGADSIHKFSIDDKQYEVKIDIKSTFLGPVDITLRSGDTEIDSDHWVLPDKSKLVLYAVAGIAIGYVVGFLIF